MKAIVKCLNCGFGVVILSNGNEKEATGSCTRCNTEHKAKIEVWIDREKEKK